MLNILCVFWPNLSLFFLSLISQALWWEPYSGVKKSDAYKGIAPLAFGKISVILSVIVVSFGNKCFNVLKDTEILGRSRVKKDRAQLCIDNDWDGHPSWKTYPKSEDIVSENSLKIYIYDGVYLNPRNQFQFLWNSPRRLIISNSEFDRKFGKIFSAIILLAEFHKNWNTNMYFVHALDIFIFSLSVLIQTEFGTQT